MKIVFELKCEDKKEIDLKDDFCQFIVDSIKNDIVSTTNLEKVRVISQKILNLKWISWISRPTSINPYYLVRFIADNVEYANLKDNLYIVRINPTICYPGSYTKLERFVRFLDKGNITVRGSHIFVNIFAKYDNKIDELWNMYKSKKLRRYKINNSFVIK